MAEINSNPSVPTSARRDPGNRRAGFVATLAICIAVLSLAVSGTVAGMVYWRLPSTWMGSYDLTTPEGTLRSIMAMQRDGAWDAIREYTQKANQGRWEEALSSFRVARMVEYRGKVILLVSFNRHGMTKKAFDVLEKDASSGLWYPVNSLSVGRDTLLPYDIEDPEVRKAVEAWIRGEELSFNPPGRRHEGAALSPVRGLVTLNGRALPDATVEFQPAGLVGSPSYGETDYSGNYNMMFTYDKEGAMPGEHIVRISKIKGGTEEGAFSGRELVPAKYNIRTELKVTVKKGKNTIDFALISN